MHDEHDTAVFCTADTQAKAISILERVRTAGFHESEISVLSPEQGGVSGIGVNAASKAPEGAVTGGGTGLLLGGALGWMAGIGALAIPGLGPFIAAGPIMAALGGAAVGAAAGGLTGALIGMGLTEYEAAQYESFVKGGHTLISVVVANDDERDTVKEIFNDAEAANISTKSIVMHRADT
jgi:hypothetical protein